jgi:hypothetical protein
VRQFCRAHIGWKARIISGLATLIRCCCAFDRQREKLHL